MNRDHDSEKDLQPGYAVLWNEIERLKQGESELKQELAHLKQQQMGVVVATTKVSAAEAAEIVISDGVAGVMPAAEAAEDEDEEVELEESTWVFPLLVGDLVGAATSTYLLVLTLVTAVIQALFLDLLRSKDSGMIEPLTAEDVDSLCQWRRTVAHDYKYYTELEEATLAKRVCGGGLSSENSKRARSAIELAASQAGLYEDLSGVPPLPILASAPASPLPASPSERRRSSRSPPLPASPSWAAPLSQELSRSPQVTLARTAMAWARAARSCASSRCWFGSSPCSRSSSRATA